LNELPTTLDETYERTLQGIPKERRRHAHRLFRCLVAASRPLRVEELGEIFAIEFDEDSAPNLMEGWRPENAEEAVLSACSTLISVVKKKRSKVVQFSHFSVREFLTSDRLLMSEDGSIRDYHIPLDGAHTILARACLTVLLQLDEETDTNRLSRFPLAFYAARYWVDHAQFGDVASQVEDAIQQLFNPGKSHFAAWTWIYDVDRGRFRGSIHKLPKHHSLPNATLLYYAVKCGFSQLADYLIYIHGEDVNARCRHGATPLYAASNMGQIEFARVLLDHGANVDTTNQNEETPLVAAYDNGHLDVMRLLIDHGANVDVPSYSFGLLSHNAAFKGDLDVIRLLLQHNANVNATSCRYNWTPLHCASSSGHAKVAEVLLEHGANINARDVDNETPLYRASINGHLEVARLLLRHGADVRIRKKSGRSLFQGAISHGRTDVAQLLLEHGAKEG